ncbi:C-terminal binding protein [Rhodococcus sp. NPDC057014]|uniref:C-terminal binding protein n=1 Tax=Rhodococcus sp. NPDC057014 TaxID=3346000 RepID=UPI0036292D6F
MTTHRTDSVLITDRAWPTDAVERKVLEDAGFDVVSGPAEAGSSEEIESLVFEHQPRAILTCWAPVSPAAINASRKLEIVARMGVGLDNIAVAAATEAGVWVTNVPDYCLDEVSDHAVGLILNWTRGISAFDREVRGGTWDPSVARLRRLSTLTVGIVGFGRIGRHTARKLAAFGCTVIANDPGATASEVDGVALHSADHLRETCDVLVLHAPLLESTRHLVNDQWLATMKPGSLLVNVSRGGLVDTNAVVASLGSGHLAGFAADVLDEEPDVVPALRDYDGAVLTPHVAFSSDTSLIELRERAAQEVVRVLSGHAPLRPCNQVRHHASKGNAHE